MSMTEQDLIAMRDDLISSRQQMEAAQATLEEKARARDEADAAYSAIPNMGGARAASMIGGPIAGAVIGQKAFGRPIAGGLAGLAAGIGGNALINNHLNRKYPDRQELLGAASQSQEDYYDYRNGEYTDSGDLYDLVKMEAVDASRTNPGMWHQVTQGVEEFPEDDFRKALLQKRKEEIQEAQAEKARSLALLAHEDQMRKLDLQERQVGIEGSAKGNSLVDERVRRAYLQNEMTADELEAQRLAAQQQREAELAAQQQATVPEVDEETESL